MLSFSAPQSASRGRGHPCTRRCCVDHRRAQCRALRANALCKLRTLDAAQTAMILKKPHRFRQKWVAVNDRLGEGGGGVGAGDKKE